MCIGLPEFLSTFFSFALALLFTWHLPPIFLSFLTIHRTFHYLLVDAATSANSYMEGKSPRWMEQGQG
jgi:hypothetical protein